MFAVICGLPDSSRFVESFVKKKKKKRERERNSKLIESHKIWKTPSHWETDFRLFLTSMFNSKSNSPFMGGEVINF